MKLLGDLLDGRREHAARAAPSRPKIHQNRPVRLHDFGFPIGITNLSDKLTHFFFLKSYNCFLKIYYYTVSTSGFPAHALYQTPPFAGTQRGSGEWGVGSGGKKIPFHTPYSPFPTPHSPSSLSRDDLAICGHIIVRRTVPGEVLAHAVELEFAPCLAVIIDHDRLIQLLGQPVA